MRKKVVISVKSRQIIDGEEETIELVTPGKFYKKENAFYVIYEETEISGMEGTTTTLKIEKNRVNLTRFGTTSTSMRFEKGMESRALYKTPYGMFELIIKPSSIKVDIDDEGGEIILLYDLEAGIQQKSTNELHIKIR